MARILNVVPPSQKPKVESVAPFGPLYSTDTVTSANGFAYCRELVSVCSHRVHAGTLLSAAQAPLASTRTTTHPVFRIVPPRFDRVLLPSRTRTSYDSS